ncbi:MAG: hypothetical protein NUV73_00325 [Candidatus Daviesbacteria bacterium]|nr:hypothetical protein [Candidatus Daviesbacteria bacterium]
MKQKGLPVRQAGLAPILIIILIAAVAGLAGFLIYSQQPKPAPPQQTTQSSPTPSVIPTPNGIGETTNWKTYQDNNYHFSIQYPQSWIIEHTNQFNTALPKNTIVFQRHEGTWDIPIVSVSNNSKVTDIEYLRKLNCDFSRLCSSEGETDLQTFLINGLKVAKLTLLQPPEIHQSMDGIQMATETALISTTQGSFWISNTYIYKTASFVRLNDYDAQKKSLDIFHKMLSTFKFTN